MSQYNPASCGQSQKFSGTYICNLECSPCRINYGTGECALVKLDRFTEQIKKIINGEKDGAE